jgi:hypothetical protein
MPDGGGHSIRAARRARISLSGTLRAREGEADRLRDVELVRHCLDANHPPGQHSDAQPSIAGARAAASPMPYERRGAMVCSVRTIVACSASGSSGGVLTVASIGEIREALSEGY